MGDIFDLDRFVSAQEPVYESALGELQHGRKYGHWMWFVFPQIRGLGRSSMAQHYGIASLDEARQYLAHPLLGPRLGECTRAVLAASAPSLTAIFGTPDDMKFRSSMTLFALASRPREQTDFDTAIDDWCGGQMDPLTLEVLASPV